MSKKKLITIISLVIGLGLLIWVLLLFSDYEPVSDEEVNLTAPHEKVLDINADEIIRIRKIVQGEDYTLVKIDEEWSVLDNDIEIDKVLVDELTTAVAGIYGEVIINEEEFDMSAYGFDEPYAKIEVELASGEVFTVNFGLMVYTNSGYYVNTESNPEKIYRIFGQTSETLLASLDSYRNNSVLDITDEEISYVNIIKTNGEYITAIKKSDELTEGEVENGAAGMVVSPWEMTSPYKLDMRNDFENVLFNLATLTIEEFVGSDGNLSQYGLDNPVVTIEYGNGEDKNVSLLIGNSSGGNSFAMRIGEEEVFKIKDESIRFIDTAAIYMVLRNFHIVNIDMVDTITIRHLEDEYIMSCKDFKINGTEVDSGKFRSAYQNIIGLTVDGLPEGEVLDNNAEVTIEYKFNNDRSNDVITFIPYSDRYYLMSLNNGERYLTERRNVTTMLEGIRGL